LLFLCVPDFTGILSPLSKRTNAIIKITKIAGATTIQIAESSEYATIEPGRGDSSMMMTPVIFRVAERCRIILSPHV